MSNVHIQTHCCPCNTMIIEDVKGNVVDLKLYRNKLSKLTYNFHGILVDLTKTDHNKSKVYVQENKETN